MSDLTANYGKLDWGEWHKCARCGHFDFVNRHRCPPRFDCGLAECGERTPIYEADSAKAAGLFARVLDMREAYPPDVRVVFVWEPATSPAPRKFIISRRMAPEYWVREDQGDNR